jgi:two-component system response regulator RegX3
MTKILLVEDEASLSEPLAFLLQKEGYVVTVAEDGRRAVDVFGHDDFSLVLLDLMLPELSGVEVCRAIRSSSQVPIIMLTAKDSEVDIVVGLELGADDFVTKQDEKGKRTVVIYMGAHSNMALAIMKFWNPSKYAPVGQC